MEVKVTITIDVPGLENDLAEAMKEKGLSFQKLGEAAGVTGTAVWQITSNKNKSIKVETLGRIAKILGVECQPNIESLAIEEVKSAFSKTS
ncbi:helix-turn-helix domain-containing protein [Nostoc sp. MG11]|uniref:helix-turn-helix domain-containing protein n=1 Tax=Nostoc sp. MG11 TaxID=2721166 RepID=UPI001866E87F|nr:helix-turn-helix transcriptional regulator [Nostoc sp. MG11]